MKQLEKLNDEQKKLVEDNIKLIYYTINRFFYGNLKYVDIEDLVGEGYIQLCLSSISYNKNLGYSFSTYFIKCYKNHLTKYLQNHYKKNFETYDIQDFYEAFSKEDTYNLEENNEQQVRELLEKYLSKKKTNILIDFYFKKMTHEEIAKKYGYKTEHVVNTLRCTAIKKLKNKEEFKKLYFEYFC